MPFKLGPTYLTRENLDREYEELQRTRVKWERRARIKRALVGERGPLLRLWNAIVSAFEMPPKPPKDRKRNDE